MTAPEGWARRANHAMAAGRVAGVALQLGRESDPGLRELSGLLSATPGTAEWSTGLELLTHRLRAEGERVPASVLHSCLCADCRAQMAWMRVHPAPAAEVWAVQAELDS